MGRNVSAEENVLCPRDLTAPTAASFSTRRALRERCARSDPCFWLGLNTWCLPWKSVLVLAPSPLGVSRAGWETQEWNPASARPPRGEPIRAGLSPMHVNHCEKHILCYQPQPELPAAQGVGLHLPPTLISVKAQN